MDRLYICELESYKNAAEEDKKWIYNAEGAYYDFEKVKDPYIRKKLKEFVLNNACSISAASMYGYLTEYNGVCSFLNSENIKIDIEKDNREEIRNRFNAYLLKSGSNLFKVYTNRHDGKTRNYKSHAYYYLNRFLRFIYREKDDEYIIYAEDYPHLKNNPVNPVKSFNLWKIKQIKMREDMKEEVIFSMEFKNATSIKSDIYAMNVFSAFLNSNYPDIQSFKDLKRKHISDYIVYLKLESGYKARTYCDLIGNIKRSLIDIGKLFEYDVDFESYFCRYEYMKYRQPIGRAYTIYELNRFNRCLKTMDEQMARCLMIHQLLGTRISDTLLLETSCLFYKDGNPVLKIRQPKVNRYMEKPINVEIAKLIERCIEYTQNLYGKTKYIFVSNKNPLLPISYNSLKYQAEEIIRKNKIKDDHGELLYFETHAFRRAYGKRLTELHIDDVTIAKLLGHNDIQSVNRYRRIGNKQIADETRVFREKMDIIIDEITLGW